MYRKNGWIDCQFILKGKRIVDLTVLFMFTDSFNIMEQQVTQTLNQQKNNTAFKY